MGDSDTTEGKPSNPEEEARNKAVDLEEARKDGDNWRRLAWIFVFLTIGATVAAVVALDSLLEHETAARVLLLIFAVLILVTVVFIHLWSLSRVREMSIAHADKALVDKTLLHKCHYCGAPECHIVCKGCDSIQWETLRRWEKEYRAPAKPTAGSQEPPPPTPPQVGDALGSAAVLGAAASPAAATADPTASVEGRLRSLEQTKKNNRKERYWTYAVLVDHYRWKLLAAVLSIGVVGTVAFGAQLEVQLWQRRADKQAAEEKLRADKQAAEEKLRADKQAAEEKLRADKQAAEEKLRADKRAAEETRAREVINATTGVRGALIHLAAFCRTKGMTDSECRDQFSIVLNQYPRLSWHAPPLLAYLMKARCSAGSSNEACRLLKEQEKLQKDIIGCMDDSFREVVAAFTTNNPKKRCESAKALYQHGRRLSCAISLLSFGPDLGDPGYTMFSKCREDLSNPKATCKDPGEPSYDSRLVWSKWECEAPPGP